LGLFRNPFKKENDEYGFEDGFDDTMYVDKKKYKGSAYTAKAPNFLPLTP